MKKAFKMLGKILLALILVLAVSLFAVFVYNKIKMKQEEPLLEKPLGQMIEVDGHSMCIYQGRY